MFGYFKVESHSWEEGIFAALFKQFSLDPSKKKKWIILDGQIDHDWAEHLNPVLDDNRKLNLSNGESINLTKQMSIMIETDNLVNTTPATISRCGVVYLD